MKPDLGSYNYHTPDIGDAIRSAELVSAGERKAECGVPAYAFPFTKVSQFQC